MNIFDVFALMGGLAIFLFGMKVMGDGLEKRGGGKLKAILESMTSNRLKGVLLGLGVTAIIQSSSATTVMVVGFVNSGIMRLNQAISVIMGANIGTTVTAWLMSLSGIEGDNIIIQLLKPSSFAPILAVIGIVFIMFLKSSKKQDTGSILVGFAVLMTGMEMMSGAVSGLKNNESFTQILTLFTNPIFGVLAGAVLTAVIQSSSASVGILQALSSTGRITFGSAIPIIMGQNIGTCITAILSAIGAIKNAKRVSVVHLSFNIIGTLCFLTLFYILHWIVDFSFIDDSVNAASIAVVHSIFNIFATVIMFPFTKGLEKLSIMVIPDDDKTDKETILDERLLSTPPIAIVQAKNVANKMAFLAKDSLIHSMELIGEYNEKIAEEIYENESKVDQYEDILGTYLVKLSREGLSCDDSHEISNLLHCIGDFERISDHAVNLLESAKEIAEKRIAFSEDAQNELNIIRKALEEILENTYKAFETEDLDLAIMVEPLEQVIDELKTKLRANHILRLQQDSCTIETGFVFSDLLTNIERTADHCSNIAVCLISVAHDSFDTHEYLHHVKNGGENNFTQVYEMYKEKYLI